MEKEQQEKEQQMRKLAAELELTKQRTDEARKVAEINKSRAENAERLLIEDCDTVKDFLTEQQFTTQFPEEVPVATVTRSPVKLKGVELPKFSGEDKTSYEPWKAAFMAMVDAQNIPVGEKMLRLQSSLSDRALALVKDLGYSSAAYERAKLKLEKRYGGERRQQINHLTTLRNWPKVRSRNLQDLEEFQALLERILITVKDCGSLQDQSLNLSAKEKLTEHDVQAYKYWLIDHAKEDCFESLVDWVELRVQIMEEAREETEGFGRKNDERGKGNREGRTRVRGFNTRSTARHCIVNTCKQDHPPWVCDAFKKLPVNKRKELISKSSRCYPCLAAGHHSKDCRKARKCGVDGCQSDKHSSYLHGSIPPNGNTNTGQQLQPEAPTFNPGPPAVPQTRNEQSGGMNYNQPGLGPSTQERTHQTSNADNISLMVLPALISNGQKQLKVNVMLDPCSTSSYISEHAAGELELHGQSLSLTIAGTGGTEVQKRSRCVELSVASLNGTFSAPSRAHVLDNIASDTPAFQWSELKRNWPHLHHVPFEKVSRRRYIDVMIGSDHPLFHLVLKEIRGSRPNDPIARLTNLGWVCFGPTLVEEFRRKSRSHFTRTYRSNHVIQQPPPDDILRKFWELESIGIKEETRQPMTVEEKVAITKVAETLTFENGRYTVGIPWREGEPRLGNNYDAALGRLQSQEKSLKRKGPDIMKQYSHIFEEYEHKGYIKKVAKSETKEQWFLPHFPVIRPDKDTTKVRVVFDAAMKCQGKSLNDAIQSGPKMQREILDVLIRFRRAPVALTADISEMFLQVGLRKEDRPYHRFLWRDFDASKEPDVYEFQRLLFGNTASPFCSQYVLHSHAQTHKVDYPEAAESVDNSMYVDDLLDSTETVETAQHLQNQLSDVLAMAGFNLRKWSSNEAAVIENVP